MRRLPNVVRDERGATSIEYGLICALTFLALFAGVSNFGVKLSSLLFNMSTNASGSL